MPDQYNTNGNGLRTPVRNGAGHAATGSIGSVATGLLVQHGYDPYLVALGMTTAAGVLGVVGGWARDRKAAGDGRILIALLSAIG